MLLKMKPFLLRWLVTTFAVFVAAPIAGIDYGHSLDHLLAASLLLGILNAFVRPVLLLLSAPLILLTLGLFIFVLNALLLLFVGQIVPGFQVPGFGSAFIGSLIISIVSWLLSAYFRASDGKVYMLTHHARIEEIKQARGRTIQ